MINLNLALQARRGGCPHPPVAQRRRGDPCGRPSPKALSHRTKGVSLRGRLRPWQSVPAVFVRTSRSMPGASGGPVSLSCERNRGKNALFRHLYLFEFYLRANSLRYRAVATENFNERKNGFPSECIQGR